MKNDDMMDKIIAGVILGLTAGAMLAIFTIGLGSSEKNECVKWREQSKQYKEFYLTKWQKDQCDHYNISIDAPVK